jgi:hypothetical protein
MKQIFTTGDKGMTPEERAALIVIESRYTRTADGLVETSGRCGLAGLDCE